jgi:hypothetical protein
MARIFYGSGDCPTVVWSSEDPENSIGARYVKVTGERSRHGVANRWRLRFLVALSDQPLVEVFGFLRTLNHSGTVAACTEE